MYRVLRKLLFLFDAETAHHLGVFALSFMGRMLGLCEWLRRKALPGSSVDLSTQVGALKLEHPIALAAGLDKNAEAAAGLFALGFAAVEVGTITPKPQPGNPKPRLFRIPEHRSLINRMGFNNDGAAVVAERLGRLRWRPGPLGVNIGKNKDTPLEEAISDYEKCVDALAVHADYVVINASSPNTPGLRQLQEPERLVALLRAVRARLDAVAPGKVLMLKIAPDLSPEAVDAAVDAAVQCGVDALIATNTTIERPVEHPVAKEAGGFSGAPMRELANAVIRRAFQRAKGKLPIIGVGGVFTADDVVEKLCAGASAVQVYSGFVYEGPRMVAKLRRELPEALRRAGLASVRDAIGSTNR